MARGRERSHGARFGTLVHAILSRVALSADHDAIAAAALFFGRILGAPEDEVAAARGVIAGALASPVLRRAAAAIELRREAPLTLVLDDCSLVEGVADLAFLETDAAGVQRWTVIDYKTDTAIAGRLGEYRAQLAIYLRAIAHATAIPARGILLWL